LFQIQLNMWEQITVEEIAKLTKYRYERLMSDEHLAECRERLAKLIANKAQKGEGYIELYCNNGSDYPYSPLIQVETETDMFISDETITDLRNKGFTVRERWYPKNIGDRSNDQRPQFGGRFTLVIEWFQIA